MKIFVLLFVPPKGGIGFLIYLKRMEDKRWLGLQKLKTGLSGGFQQQTHALLRLREFHLLHRLFMKTGGEHQCLVKTGMEYWMLINLSQYQYKTRQGLVMIFTAVNGMWNRILKWMRTACT